VALLARGYRRLVGVTVSIRDQAGTRASAEPALELDVPAAVTLRDLIRTRVREEVAKANAAVDNGKTFQTLVQPTEGEATLNGYRSGDGFSWRLPSCSCSGSPWPRSRWPQAGTRGTGSTARGSSEPS
jgi:hypothetical protein